MKQPRIEEILRRIVGARKRVRTPHQGMFSESDAYEEERKREARRRRLEEIDNSVRYTFSGTYKEKGKLKTESFENITPSELRAFCEKLGRKRGESFEFFQGCSIKDMHQIEYTPNKEVREVTEIASPESFLATFTSSDYCALGVPVMVLSDARHHLDDLKLERALPKRREEDY